MQFGRTDLGLTSLMSGTIPSRNLEEAVKPLLDYSERASRDLSELNLEEIHLQTVEGIITSGPFAGPFVVDVVRYTGAFRTKYFWNGHSILRRDLYLCGDFISVRRWNRILDALCLGAQIDNSTVPMCSFDLSTGLKIPVSEDLLNNNGEATPRYMRAMLGRLNNACGHLTGPI